jgi:uncharacterized protein (DUF488 family)
MTRLATIGHGAVDLETFLQYLKNAGIESLVDVRRFAGSRKHPHFSSDSLAAALRDAGIAYEHAVDLGGRRKASPDSPNRGLRNEAFRAYADWMRSDEFRTAFDRLMAGAKERKTAVMCAETLWWRCHRRLISDAAELLTGAEVTHWVGGKPAPHKLTEGVVRRAPGDIYYPGSGNTTGG